MKRFLEREKKMSDPNYKHIGTPIMRIIEECGEILQAAMKLERFGWDNHHPSDPPEWTNLDNLEKEILHLNEAVGDLIEVINKKEY